MEGVALTQVAPEVFEFVAVNYGTLVQIATVLEAVVAILEGLGMTLGDVVFDSEYA